MNEVRALRVTGQPATAGSKRAFRHRSTGRVVVLDDCKRGKTWRLAIQQAWLLKFGNQPFGGPIRLQVGFYLPRPKSHYNRNGLKKEAPTAHITRPDVTKMLRAVEDALNGLAWFDDSQVTEQSAHKDWCAELQEPGVVIVVTQIKGIE